MVRPRNGKWVADIKVGRNRRIRKTFDCKSDAESFEAVTREQLRQETLLDYVPHTNGDTVGKWLPLIAKDLWGEKVDEVNMRGIIRTWVKHFGPDKLMKDIRTSDVEHFVMERRLQGSANSTINQYTTRLNKMLKKAKRLDLIHIMPEIVSAGKAGHRQRYLKDDEASQLIAAFPPYYQLFTTFLLYTGARLGEAVGLMWADVDDATLTFRDTKNGKDRVIPMSGQVLEVLDDLRDLDCHDADGLVFNGYARTTFRRRWKEVKEALGHEDDPDIVPHILRHTCASRLVKANVNIATVQKFLGHSDIQMTMRYVHLDVAALTTAADALSAL